MISVALDHLPEARALLRGIHAQASQSTTSFANVLHQYLMPSPMPKARNSLPPRLDSRVGASKRSFTPKFRKTGPAPITTDIAIELAYAVT